MPLTSTQSGTWKSPRSLLKSFMCRQKDGKLTLNSSTSSLVSRKSFPCTSQKNEDLIPPTPRQSKHKSPAKKRPNPWAASPRKYRAAKRFSVFQFEKNLKKVFCC